MKWWRLLMHEAFTLQLLEMAERWAEAAGTTLRHRKFFAPTVFTVTRRPEERALLAAAVELYDLVGATPEGVMILRSMGLEPDAGALLEEHELEARWNEWCAQRLSGKDDGSAGQGGAAMRSTTRRRLAQCARCKSISMVSSAVSPDFSAAFAMPAKSFAKACCSSGGSLRTVANTTAPRSSMMALAVSAVNGWVLSLMCSFKGCCFRFVGVRGPRVIFRHVAACSAGRASFLRVPSLLLGRAAGGLFLHGDFSAWVHALKSLFFAQKKHSERFRMIRNRSERCGQHSHEVSCCE